MYTLEQCYARYYSFNFILYEINFKTQGMGYVRTRKPSLQGETSLNIHNVWDA